MGKARKDKSAIRSGGKDSAGGTSDENAKEVSPHPAKDKSRLRRHRSVGVSNVDSLDSDSDHDRKSQRRRRKKKKKHRSSRGTTATTGTTGTSSERTTGRDRRSKSGIPPKERKSHESKPKELSEKDLVDWMQKMVPYVEANSPLWNKWTLSPLYHFIRNPSAVLCIAFVHESSETDQGVLSRLSKICKGNLITFNELIPEHRGDFFYFLKFQPVSIDGLNYEEVVMFGNVPCGNQIKGLNNLLVHYWTPILFDDECLPAGIKNDVFTELNTVSCVTQTTTHYLSSKSKNELLLHVPPEICGGGGGDGEPGERKILSDHQMARDKEFTTRLEETVVYWVTKLKQVVILQELDGTDTWPGPLEEIQFWANRSTNLRNILAQFQTQPMRRVLRILAISHSPYLLELRSILEEVSTCHKEASSNAHYLHPLSQPLEKIPKCPLKQVRVEIQKVLWLTLTIWRNAPYYSLPSRLNSLLRKFSNALIFQCRRRLHVDKLLEGHDIPKSERKLKNCLKCLEWWREIYKMTEAMYANKACEKAWIFDENQIFVHVDALMLRIQDLLEICQIQRLYKIAESLPLYPGIKGPYIAGVMKSCDRLLSSKLHELGEVTGVVLNVKSTEWHVHMKGFRETVLVIDMSVQNVLEESFEQLPNLKRKVELLQLFHRFYGKREVVTRQLDKLCVKLYEHFEGEVLRLRKLFERKIVPLPKTYTQMAGKGTWAELMKRRIETDLEILKKAESWLPRTSGVGFQNLVKGEAKSLAEAMGAFGAKCYNDWAKDFQQLESHATRENHRGKLEVPLLIRGKGQLVKVNFDRGVYRNLNEAEMWARLGRSVPTILLLTIYPWRDKLHGLRENVWMVAKWYNKCVGELSRDERLLFKDRLLPVEKKIYPCLAHGEFTWTSGRTADQQFLEDFRPLTQQVVDNVREYREATSKIAGIVAKICERRLVKVRTLGGRRATIGRAYSGVDEFRKEQTARISKELKKIVKGYREIGSILKELFANLFLGDCLEVKVQWEKYVNLLDGCVEEALKWSVRKSLEILEEVIGKDDGEKPFFLVKMMLDGDQLRFEPDLVEMSEMIMGVHGSLAKAMEPLVRLGRFLGTGKVEVGWKSGGVKKEYSDSLLSDEVCLEIQRRLQFAVERCLSELNLYSERWIPYRDIWEVDRDQFICNYEKQYPDMEAYEKDLKRYMEISEIVLGGDAMVTIRWLQVDCVKLREGISEESTEWFRALGGTLYEKAKENLLSMYGYMEKNRKDLTKEPETLQEQLEMWSTAQTVRGEVRKKVFDLFPGIEERFELLRRYNFEIEPEVGEMQLNMETEWRKYMRFLRQTDDKLEKSRERLKQAFLELGVLLKGRVDELQKLWELKGPFSRQLRGNDGEVDSVQALTQLENFGNELETLKEEEIELIRALETFDLNEERNNTLIELESDITWLAEVWKVVAEWEGHWSEWKSEKIHNLDVDAIDGLSKQFVGRFRELNKQFEMKSWPVICEMIDLIGIIQESLKCIQFLKQQTLQARHWEWIKGLIAKKIHGTIDQLPSSPDKLDLESMITWKIHYFLGPISEISCSSEKEMAVEKAVGKIKDFWENESFILRKLKTSDATGGDIPLEIQCGPGLKDCLMDHIVSLSAMRGSRFIGIFQESVYVWERTLQKVNETLEVLLETQRELLLLDRVLSNEHIQRLMPGASRSFSVVTSVWASVLLIVTRVRYVVRIVNETESLLEMLKDLQRKMGNVGRELAVYLQSSRQEFPRFYFLPDNQLLGILGRETGEMEDLLEGLRKIFGNFESVSLMNEEDTQGAMVVDGILSEDEQEVLRLIRPVEIWKGPMESWLADLEKEILASVKGNLMGCLEHLGGSWNKMEELVLSGADQWTGQSLVTAVKIQWTADVSKAIHQSSIGESLAAGRGELTLKKIAKRFKRNVTKFVGILRGMEDRTSGQGEALEGVVVTMMYLSDVTERLHARNCGDLESFEWLQYMRWYISDHGGGGGLIMKQGFATIPYGWEYCSGSSRVITPTTERCILALTTAIGFQMGAVIQGLWNSGKSETIKALGCQLGKLVLNLRVNQNTEHQSVSSIITGIVQTGAWAVFADIDHCTPEIVQLVVNKLTLITNAKLGNYGKVLLDGMECKLNPGCGIFSMKAIPNCSSSLNRAMRPVTLMQPDSKNILDIKLFLSGFENSATLAKKIETVFQIARDHFQAANQLSRAHLFSLSSMLVVIQRASQLKNLHGKRLKEPEAMVKALEYIVLPSLTSDEEVKMFRDLLKTHFPTDQVAPTLKGENFHLEHFVRQSFSHLGYQISERMVSQCMRLYELSQVYRAVVIVGKTGSGKSVIRKILKNALTLLHQHKVDDLLSDEDNNRDSVNEDECSDDNFINEYIINPVTVEREQLFGCSRKTGGNDKWREGIVSKILKNHQHQSEETSLWLVFDGSLQNCCVPEEINDLCNQESSITLASCDRLATPKQVNVFFEVDTLNDASPALLSRCGVLFIKDANTDENELSWKLSLDSWLNELNSSTIKTELTGYVKPVLEKCLTFRSENCSSLIASICALQLVEMFMALQASFLKDEKLPKLEESGQNERLSLAIKQSTAFCIVWSVFIGLDEENRQKASVFLKDVPPLQPIFPAKRTVFDYFLDTENQKWVKWEFLLEQGSEIIRKFDPTDDMIDTIDTIKAGFLLKRYHLSGASKSTLVCGPKAAGKSKLVVDTLKKYNLQVNGHGTNSLPVLHIQVTPKITAKSVQSLIQSRLESVSSSCLSPAAGKSLTVFIDDINACSTTAGEMTWSSCGEFTRYLMEYWMWYDPLTAAPIAISNVGVIAAWSVKNPTSTHHFATISARLQRRFCMVYLPKPDEFQLRRIFTQKAKRKLESFAPAVKLLADDITIATLETFKLISTEIGLQSWDSSNFHHAFCIFDLHDISRVYKSLYRAHKESQDTKLGFIRLWFNECTRIFHDRLPEPTSRLACLGILERQLVKHFEISPATLSSSSILNSSTDTNVSSMLFGNFMKESKCYEEIKNATGARKLIQEKLELVAKGVKPVVVFKEAISQVVKMARVLSQRKGHLITCGVEGQGRETQVQVAASLYQYKIFQMPISHASGGNDEDKLLCELLRNAYYTCATENVGCCLILKNEQITEMSLEWISVITTTVELPELFSKVEILEMHKKWESNQRNGDDAIVVDAMTWFKERVENNLHVAICITPTNDQFFRNISSHYSMLLKTMTVNWFEIWTEASFLEVASSLLKPETFKVIKNKDTSPTSLSIFYSIHAIAAAEDSHLIAPSHFLNFMVFFNWYLKTASDEYSRRMKMFKNAIQEIGNVRSKIGSLTDQAEMAERKAEAARQECAKMLLIIQQQEADTNEQDSIVSEQNGQMEQEIKEYEELASVIKEEWSQALGDFEKETEVLQDLAEDDLTHIRSYPTPPPLVSRVLDAVMIMLDKETSWPEAKIQLGHPGFIKSIVEYDKARLTIEKLNSLKKFLQNKEFTPEDVSKYSNGARILCAWIHAIEKYGRLYLAKVCPKREKLENSEQSILEHKHVLLLASEKLQLLRENLTEIQTIYETKWQLKESLEEDARKCSDVLGRAVSVLNLLEQENGQNNHIQKWKENLIELEMKLEKVEENALLSSAVLAYGGVFSGRARRKLKEMWKQEIENFLGVKIKTDWRLEEALDFEKLVDTRDKIQVLLSGFYSQKCDEDEQESEWLVENILMVKMSRRDVLCVDPHNIQQLFGWNNGGKGKVLEGKNVADKLMEYYNESREKGNLRQWIFVTKDVDLEKMDTRITCRFTVVNFSLGQQGLKNHFMQTITRLICAEEESRRQTLIQSALAETLRIADFKEKIPKLVISCGGASILNNGEFPDTLSKWKDEVQQSHDTLDQVTKEVLEIESAQQRFLYAAAGFTRLFETVNEMTKLSSLYEISLAFFDGLIEKSFNDQFQQTKSTSSEDASLPSPRKDVKEKMIDYLEEDIPLKLFRFVSKSMLRQHCYQFCLLLCIKTLLDEIRNSQECEQFRKEIWVLSSINFNENSEMVNEDRDNGEFSWLTKSQAEIIERLHGLKGFHGLRDSVFVSEALLWKEWMTNRTKSEAEQDLPAEWNSKLTPFHVCEEKTKNQFYKTKNQNSPYSTQIWQYSIKYIFSTQLQL